MLRRNILRTVFSGDRRPLRRGCGARVVRSGVLYSLRNNAVRSKEHTRESEVILSRHWLTVGLTGLTTVGFPIRYALAQPSSNRDVS